jgi:uncharacterized protein YecT (DUF1311 family)
VQGATHECAWGSLSRPRIYFGSDQLLYRRRKSADQQLNRTYEQIRKTLVEEDKKKLQEAQRIWLQFRDANCTAERELYSGGSAASMVYAACIEADTRHRTSELKTMYEWKVDK